MSDHETYQSYHCVSKLIHWTTAFIILALLCLGFYMTSMDTSPQKYQIYAIHKSFGLLVLALVFVRLVAYILLGKPKSLPSHQKWEKILAHAAHLLLYLAMVALPLSGWIMSSAGEFPIVFFGLDVPPLMAKDENIFHSSRDVHEILAFIVIVVIGLHVLGAAKHHIIDKDQTLGRMTKKKISMSGGFIIIIFALFALTYPGLKFLEEVADIFMEQGQFEKTGEDKEYAKEGEENITRDGWLINHEESRLEFTAMQYGQPISGRFKKFNGEILFDPDHLEDAHVHIIIDIDSIETGSGDRDAQIVSPEWFNAKLFPEAIFKADQFEKGQEENQYVAHGQLTIRDMSMPLDMPFTLDIEKNSNGQSAVMHSEVTINRLDYGVGQGQWQSTDVIANPIKVSVSLQAQKKE